MAEPTLHDVLTELTTLRAKVAEQERWLAGRAHWTQARQARRRLLPILFVTMLVALVPLSTLAATPFGDLNNGSVHNGNIDAIYQAGITRGCVPDVAYCPNDFVTRQEMASFLARTAGLGGNAPVANALTATNATSAQNAVNANTATSAGNANTVGGIAPNGLIRVAQAMTPNSNPVFLDGEFKTLVSVTIGAPAAGFILVTATVDAVATSSAVTGQGGFLQLRDTGPGAATPLSAGIGDGSRIPLTFVFPVPAAGQRTIVLEAMVVGVTGNARQAVITALYVPFGATGGNTLDLP